MPVTNISSVWSSGNLVFYETAVGRSVTGDVFTIATDTVTIGGTSQDVDFKWYATGSKSFILDAGAGTMTLAGVDVTITGDLTLDVEDLKLGDDQSLEFGDADGGDIAITFTDGTGLALVGTGSAENLLLGNDTYAINTTLKGTFTVGIDGTGYDVKLYGDTSGCYTLYDESEDLLSVIQTNASTSGTERSVNIEQTHTGAGAIAETLRVSLTSNVALGDWANAIFGRIDLSTTGLVSGLVGVVCAELNMPGGTIAGGSGTYSCYEAEINCPTSYDSTVPIDVFRINAWGAAVGKFDDYGYLFDITGVTSDAAHIWYDNQKAAPAVEEFIRVKTPSGVRYLALYDANA